MHPCVPLPEIRTGRAGAGTGPGGQGKHRSNSRYHAAEPKEKHHGSAVCMCCLAQMRRKEAMDLKVSTAPDGGKYAADKPASCAYCFFWDGKKAGCELEECFYLMPEETDSLPSEDASGQNGCGGCPYGRAFPCIGYCLRKIMQELKVGRDGR